MGKELLRVGEVVGEAVLQPVVKLLKVEFHCSVLIHLLDQRVPQLDLVVRELTAFRGEPVLETLKRGGFGLVAGSDRFELLGDVGWKLEEESGLARIRNESCWRGPPTL